MTESARPVLVEALLESLRTWYTQMSKDPKRASMARRAFLLNQYILKVYDCDGPEMAANYMRSHLYVTSRLP